MTNPPSDIAVCPPWWLWPNLLALDAPVVAVTWQRFLAATEGITVPAAASVALGLVVWGVYLADRWLDAGPGRPAEAAARHRFARRHPRAIAVPAVVLLATGGVAAVLALPVGYLTAGAGVAVLLGVYLAAVHIGRSAWLVVGEKEFAVGLVFAAGVAVPLAAERADAAADWLPGVAAFGAACWLNCGLIARWEGTDGRLPGWVLGIAGGTAVGSAVTAPAPVAAAVVGAVAALGALHLVRERVSVSARRVLADAALLTPLAVGVWP